MAWDPNNCEWMVHRHGAVFLYSSLCGGEAVLTLGDVDIEDGVPGRVQVERGREEVEEGEKQERNRRERTKPTDDQTHIMDDMKME